MKIEQDDFEALQNLVVPFLKTGMIPSAQWNWQQYKEQGLTETHFCMDVFHAVFRDNRNREFFKRLYSYLNDKNIGAAMRKICAPYIAEEA